MYTLSILNHKYMRNKNVNNQPVIVNRRSNEDIQSTVSDLVGYLNRYLDNLIIITNNKSPSNVIVDDQYNIPVFKVDDEEELNVTVCVTDSIEDGL